MAPASPIEYTRELHYTQLDRMNPTEIAANVFNAAAILLAGRNSVHTWWTSIVGCTLFGFVFYAARLYADVTLQGFFVVASILGWWRWVHGAHGAQLPVRYSRPAFMAAAAAGGSLVAVGYGWLLHTFTDAYAPFLDSIILAFSVLGQLLLVWRRVENWWCWLLVNTIAVPLYATRGLYVTAALYVGFWLNALIALRTWRRLAAESARA
jgi:nicotinamide mononucleotide transporter